MKPVITSRELLAAAGVETEDKPEIPLEYRPLLITSVITCVPAKKFMKVLNQKGFPASLREVIEWQHATRKWLGLPEIGRGKPSNEYRNEVKSWLQHHGNPTPEDIDAGWLPRRLRGKKGQICRELSPRYESMIRCFRNELMSLKSAKSDEDAMKLLEKFLGSVLGNSDQP